MDELQLYLKRKDPQRIIIGDADCNLLLVGYEQSGFTQIKAILLTVGLPDIASSDVAITELRNKYRNNMTFKVLFDRGKHLAQKANKKFAMIAYKIGDANTMSEKDVDSMVFLAKQIYPSLDKGILYDSEQFVNYIYRLIEKKFFDRGTFKAKNKSIADAFHLWSRTKLSAHIVKQDFDIIYYHNKYVMIEVKRAPSKTVKEWKPYYDDRRNYDIQFKISQALNVPFFTLHHTGGNCNDNTMIGFYKIHNVDANASIMDWMIFDKQIVKANEIIKKFEETLHE